MSKILIFHHSDLDGMGVKIVAIRAAQLQEMEYETFKCNYTDVNEIVRERLSKGLAGVTDIVLGDISVDADTAVILDEACSCHNVNLILRDHHATAEHLNMYDWALVREHKDGTPYCGTWLLAEVFPEVADEFQAFIQTVDDWDTWKWTKNGNNTAKNLNALFQVIGEERFTEYILRLYEGTITDPAQLFNSWAASIVEAHDLFVEKTARNCENSMWTMDVKVPLKQNTYKTGVIFANNDLSDIANIILAKHPELDILMIISYPKTISYRTRKSLDIPLGDLAQMVTGKGGGHPQSAGSTISAKVFSKTFERTLKTMSGNLKGLEFNNLKQNGE